MFSYVMRDELHRTEVRDMLFPRARGASCREWLRQSRDSTAFIVTKVIWAYEFVVVARNSHL